MSSSVPRLVVDPHLRPPDPSGADDARCRGTRLMQQRRSFSSRRAPPPPAGPKSRTPAVQMVDEGKSSGEPKKSELSDEEPSENEESNYNSTGTGGGTDESSDEHYSDGSDCDEDANSNLSKFQSQFNIGMLFKIIDNLTHDQKLLVQNCGFGSILHLKCKQLPHKVHIIRLARFYDEKTQCMQISGTRAFKIDAKLVHWILGIPYGGHKICQKVSQMTKSLIGEDTIPGSLAPKIDALIDLIKPGLVGDRFLRVFLLVVISIFLCPSSAARASYRYYNGICSVKKIKSYDWCDAVASCLNSGLSNFKISLQKKSSNPALTGCLFVLCIAFFDYLGSDIGIVPDTIPRIDAWTDDHFDRYMVRFPRYHEVQVFVPACKNRYWYVVIANFREHRFEVICPFKDLSIIKEDALTIVRNFRKVFNCAYPIPRRVHIWKMEVSFATVSNSLSQNDSGVFVLEILKSYDGRTHLFFKEEHAKAIREALTYYLCTHKDNELLLPAIREIVQQHGLTI